jgi:ribonuclease HI
VSFDPHALKIYVDGSCLRNPGGPGGFAIWVEYPFEWDRADEPLEHCGYFETNTNRMELKACLFAHQWIVSQERGIGVERVQIITDSLYVSENYKRSVTWSQNAWRTSYGRPIENKDLWKELHCTRRKLHVRVEVVWMKGKTSEILKAVDRSAKHAARIPSRPDRGFRTGKIGRPKNNVKQAARLFPASGQELIIRVYCSVAVRRRENKVKFQLYSEEKKGFFEKFAAYANMEIAGVLHRHHAYRVQMNSVPQYPRIEEILAEVKEADLVAGRLSATKEASSHVRLGLP